MSDPADLTIVEAGAKLRSGALTSSDLTEAVIERARISESHLHAYLTLDQEGARAKAAAADAALAAGEDRGPLHGIPIALKDNMCTKGIETTASSQILAGWVPPYSATVVNRLSDAGSVLIGKTNLDEFAMGSSTENSAYGPTRNPWNTDTVPGGSSGGSAAAVAAGSALGALGSDTGGSIRQPAALCGVVGVKPTYGLVSRYGLIAFASSLDQIGPFTRTVEDSSLMLEAIAGHDLHDATSIRGDVPDFGGSLRDGVAGLKIGVIKELSGDEIDSEVRGAVSKMTGALADAGADVREVSLPSCEYGLSAYYLIAPAECSANLARFDGVRFGLRAPGATTEEMMAASRAEGFGPEVIRRILLGTYALSAGYYDAFYGQAQRVRTLIRQQFAAAYEDVDVLVAPTSPTTAFDIGAKADDPIAMYYADVCTIPINLTGDPGASIPIGLDSAGLPIGYQVMAPALGEERMFQVAQAVEDIANFTARAPTGDLRGGEPMTDYEAVIGIETHVELMTDSKMFCGCPVKFGEPPNTTTCPVCLGLPGALPVPNAEAMEGILQIGTALDCQVAPTSFFHRKNYFYPDLPKNYQISQYDVPICHDGQIQVEVDGEDTAIGITRVHMEEDTGKSIHVGGGGRIHDAEYSLLDFNRSGVPLVEIVTEPDIRSAEQARAYGAELQRIVRTLGVSDARLEEGSMRFDANISIRPVGATELGTRAEVKNVNSLRSLQRAVSFEIQRQIQLVESGGTVVQETRHWNEDSGKTTSMRSKEESEDYRYFQEPDLVPIEVSAEWRDSVIEALPELPAARRARYKGLGVDSRVASVLVSYGAGLGDLFERAMEAGGEPRLIGNWLSGEIVAWSRAEEVAIADTPLTPAHLVELAGLVGDATLSASAAKQVLAGVLAGEGSPAEVAADRDLVQISDSSVIEAEVDAVLAAHADAVASIQSGDNKPFGFLVGQVMRATGGKADPKQVSEMIRAKTSR